MAGLVKGSTAWKQRMVGMMHNDILRLHEMYPNDNVHEEALKELTKDLGRFIDFYLNEDKPVRPMADVMIERIFEEK